MPPSGPAEPRPRPDVSPRGILAGLVVGVLIVPAMLAAGWSGSGSGGTWLGLPIFASVLAAGLAAFVLRAGLRSRRVGEHACAQTLATSMVAPGVGVLLAASGALAMFSEGPAGPRTLVAILASVAGCLIALSMIGPLRRAAMDAADLPFPSGRAGTLIGRGGGRTLVIAMGAAIAVTLPARLPGVERPASLDELDALVHRERITHEDALRTRMIAGFAEARSAPAELIALGEVLRETPDSAGRDSRIEEARRAWSRWLAANARAGAHAVESTPDELALRVSSGAWGDLRDARAGWARAPLLGYADLSLRTRAVPEPGGPRVDFAFNGLEPDAPPQDVVLTRESDRDRNGQADLLLTDDALDLGRALGVPPQWPIVLAIAPFALGAGLIAGPRGLWIAAGSVLAWLVLAPLALRFGFVPASVRPEDAGAWSAARMHGPIGIGVLLGGGICVAIVAIRAMTAREGDARDEAPRGPRLGAAMGLTLAGVGVVALVISCMLDTGDAGDPSFASGGLLAAWDELPRGIIGGVLGALLVGLACIVVAPTRGLSDWTPLVPVAGAAGALGIMLSADVGVALVCACVAAAVLTGNLLSDGVTAHFAGVRPRTQQWLALAGVGLGAALALGTLGLGAGHVGAIPAPLPELSGAMRDAALSGRDAGAMVVLGAIVGGLLGMGALSGLGVLIGAGMCMPIGLALTFGAGCVARAIVHRVLSQSGEQHAAWVVRVGAGLMLGQVLVEWGVAVARIALSAS